MIDRLQTFWSVRTPRERVMLCIMMTGVAAFGFWLLVVRPLDQWAAAAAGRRVQAEAVAAQVKAIPPARPAPPAHLEATLRSTASARGLDPVLGMAEDGGLGFRFNAAGGRDVLLWLADVKAASGAEPKRLSMLAEDGRLAIDGAF